MPHGLRPTTTYWLPSQYDPELTRSSVDQLQRFPYLYWHCKLYSFLHQSHSCADAVHLTLCTAHANVSHQQQLFDTCVASQLDPSVSHTLHTVLCFAVLCKQASVGASKLPVLNVQ